MLHVFSASKPVVRAIAAAGLSGLSANFAGAAVAQPPRPTIPRLRTSGEGGWGKGYAVCCFDAACFQRFKACPRSPAPRRNSTQSSGRRSRFTTRLRLPLLICFSQNVFPLSPHSASGSQPAGASGCRSGASVAKNSFCASIAVSDDPTAFAPSVTAACPSFTVSRSG